INSTACMPERPRPKEKIPTVSKPPGCVLSLQKIQTKRQRNLTCITEKSLQPDTSKPDNI
ncbi:hypothetical protein AVEN_67434-1, partial [Araneus ventricosus]